MVAQGWGEAKGGDRSGVGVSLSEGGNSPTAQGTY